MNVLCAVQALDCQPLATQVLRNVARCMSWLRGARSGMGVVDAGLASYNS